jgi:hypothetical protein
MSVRLWHKDCRTQLNTPCPSSGLGEVVAVFLISLCVQFQTEFRQLLSSWHFWKSNIFFICGILFVHVSGMLDQTFYITRVNSLSRFECWSNYNETGNQANWAQIRSNQLWLRIFEIIQNSWRFISWARTWAAHAAQAEAEPGQAGPRALHRPAAPVLCNWAAADSAQWQLIYFSIFQIYSNSCK